MDVPALCVCRYSQFSSAEFACKLHTGAGRFFLQHSGSGPREPRRRVRHATVFLSRSLERAIKCSFCLAGHAESCLAGHAESCQNPGSQCPGRLFVSLRLCVPLKCRRSCLCLAGHAESSTILPRRSYIIIMILDCLRLRGTGEQRTQLPGRRPGLGPSIRGAAVSGVNEDRCVLCCRLCMLPRSSNSLAVSSSRRTSSASLVDRFFGIPPLTTCSLGQVRVRL